MKHPEKLPRFPIWKKIALTAVLTAAVAPAWTASASEASDRMQQVLNLLSTTHVSGVSEEALSDSAIKAMVDSLNDPYTQYMSKKEWSQFEGSLSRSYVGVGIMIGKTDDGIFIEQVFKGAPALEAGLERNDKIVNVNDKDVTGYTTDQLVNLIVGEENTNVTITVLRGDQHITKTMPRRAVSLPVVESSYLDGGVGYVKIHSFSDNSDELFSDSLAAMKAKGDFKSLVVDLRDNPGGLLESAAYIASEFVKDNVLIHTKTRAGTDEPVKIVGGNTLDLPVYVLVNENSASASEVLAGALQDYGVAVIAGTKTYGKGSVQNVYPLTDGSKLKVTIEEYLTPKGHPVNKIGITPDVALEGDMNQLLSVLHMAGAKELTVTKERSLVTVNGTQVSDPLPVFEEDGRLWIHSRVLAAMVGAELEWQPEVQGVELTVKGSTAKPVFDLTSGTARRAGDLLFIDAAEFAKAYDGFTVEGNAVNLKLKSVLGN
jgi:carboxyl-terminal processing protease